VNKINEEVKRLFKKEYKKITLNTHPFIAAFLTKGFPSIRTKWFLEHKKWVKIQPRDAYTYLEYHFHDKDGKLIKSYSQPLFELQKGVFYFRIFGIFYTRMVISTFYEPEEDIHCGRSNRSNGALLCLPGALS